MIEKTSRCLGWLEGFSSTVWALVSTNDGAKLVDSSAADEYDKVVKELADELGRTVTANPYGVVAMPLTNPPSVPQYPSTIPTTKPIITCKNDASLVWKEDAE